MRHIYTYYAPCACALDVCEWSSPHLLLVVVVPRSARMLIYWAFFIKFITFGLRLILSAYVADLEPWSASRCWAGKSLLESACPGGQDTHHRPGDPVMIARRQGDGGESWQRRPRRQRPGFRAAS